MNSEMNPYVDALNAINDANLPPAVLRTANRLLALVHQDNGYITLSWDETMAICGVRNRKSVWRNLGALKAARVIHYSTNDAVDVTFEAWRTPRNERVEPPKRESGTSHFGTTNAAEDQPLPETREWNLSFRNDECGEYDKKEPISRNERVEPPKRESGTSQKSTPWLVGIDHTLTPCSDLDLKTNQPKPVSAGDIDRNRALLIDPEVGLGERQAERLAKAHTFDWLLRQVFAWREDMHQGKVNGPGALVARLDRAFAPGDLTERDRASPLYQRHVSEEERRAAVSDRYTPAEYEELINT